MFPTDIIFRQQENLVDNQKCQARFRPLCNKIQLCTRVRKSMTTQMFVKFWFHERKNSVSISSSKITCNRTVIVEIWDFSEWNESFLGHSFCILRGRCWSQLNPAGVNWSPEKGRRWVGVRFLVLKFS